MKIVAGMMTLALTLIGHVQADDVTRVPSFDQFLVVPLRVHVVVSQEYGMTNTQISDREVARSVGAINAIWSKGGISFGLDSIVREPAGQLERFKTLVKLNDGQFASTDPFALLLPRGSSRVFDGLHLYIVHELPERNGFYIEGADAVLTVEKPSLRQVPGGSSDPLARVAARFLGEAIGLTGRDDEVGLGSGGTNGVGLNEAEIARVRQLARTIPGARKVADLAREAAEAAAKKDIDKARRCYTWLAEIPGAGPGAAEARKQLGALPAALGK